MSGCSARRWGSSFRHAGWDGQASDAAPALIELILDAESRAEALERPRPALNWAELLGLQSAERVFGVNLFEGARWLRKESLQVAVDCIAAALRADDVPIADPAPVLTAAEACGYRWDELLRALLPAAD